MKSVFTKEYGQFLVLLIKARKDAGLSQQALANCLRRPQSFVSKYERGERRLDVIEFIKIAQALDLSATDIISKLEQKLTAAADKRGRQ